MIGVHGWEKIKREEGIISRGNLGDRCRVQRVQRVQRECIASIKVPSDETAPLPCLACCPCVLLMRGVIQSRQPGDLAC